MKTKTLLCNYLIKEKIQGAFINWKITVHPNESLSIKVHRGFTKKKCSSFSIRCNRKTPMNFMAKPILSFVLSH